MESKAGTQSMEKLHDTSGGSDNKMRLVLSIIALLLAVIGVIIAAVGLSQSNGTNNFVINSAGKFVFCEGQFGQTEFLVSLWKAHF